MQISTSNIRTINPEWDVVKGRYFVEIQKGVTAEGQDRFTFQTAVSDVINAPVTILYPNGTERSVSPKGPTADIAA